MTWTEGEQPADEWGQEDGAVGYEAPVESYGGGGGGDRSCRSCGQEGHFARECPDKKSQACFRCGEEGHRKTECPNQSSRSNGVCRKCNEEGHMARECPNAPPMVCRTCNEEGHSARDCPQGMTCRYCKEEGHMARECPTAPPRVCNKCKEEGHMSRDCPTAGPETCFNCGQEGHRSSDCTNEAVERLGEDGLPLPPPVTYIPPQLEAITDATFDMLHHEEANISRYDTMDVTVSDPQFEVPIYSFAEAGFSEGLMAKIVTKLKFTAPTPIQKFCIPIIAAGRDVIACSQTGSGKSAAFILPILQSIMNDPELPDRESIRGQRTQSPLVVVLSPTRELCVQLYEHFRLFSEENPRRIGVSPAYGGTQVRYNAEQIRSGTHVLCAVPGRLKQFVDDKTISFSKVKFLVLDEADRMLDHGFQDAIKTFHEHETMVPKTNRQTLMFSATFSEVEDLARQMMKPDAVKVVVGILGGVNSDVEQSFVETPDVKAKREKLKSILADIPGSSTGEAENMQPGAGGKVMVFVERKNAADILGAFLSSSGFSATTMHGDRDQQQREEALRTFRNGKHAILVATEVAARGLDIKGLGMVINFDMPQDIDKYVHRVGRTGRVGTAGKAVSFFDPAKDSQIAPHLVKVLNECGQAVPDFISNAASGYSADDFGGGDAGGDGDGWGNGEDEWGS